ncbi:MAG: CoA transferase [Granulosicoccus sp.]|nr:CoA transferase [Granulosicoccus sp.]
MSSILPALHEIQSALPAVQSAANNQPSQDEANASGFTFTGTGALPSCYAVTELATASLAASGGELARYLKATGRDGGDVIVDQRLSSLWFGFSTRAVGWDFPSIWDAIAGDYATADGWIRLHTNKPEHRDKALQVLRCDADRDAVATAVKLWNADELEKRIVDAGGCAARMMSREQWLVHPQGRAVTAEPLIAWSEIELPANARTARPLLDSSVASSGRPLAGLKVLDLTRVLAGPACTRLLAAFGAEVLRIDPPDWNEFLVTVEMSVGKRRAGLDLKQPGDLACLKALMAEADVLVHGYRSDALEQLGIGNDVRASINPTMIDVALCAYGWTGPWATRRGFDSLVQMSGGIAEAGMQHYKSERPHPLPVQALDHATGYLMAAAVLNALTHRASSGSVRRARLSLARTAELLVSLQVPGTQEIINDPVDSDYQPETELTSWGKLSRLKFPLQLARAPMLFERPAGELRVDSAQWLI